MSSGLEFSPLTNTLLGTFISFSLSAGHRSRWLVALLRTVAQTHSCFCPAVCWACVAEDAHLWSQGLTLETAHVSCTPYPRGDLQRPLILCPRRKREWILSNLHTPFAFAAVMNPLTILRPMYLFCCETSIHLIAHFSFETVVFCHILLVRNIY